MDLTPVPEPPEASDSLSVTPEADTQPSSKSKSKLELGRPSRKSDLATAADPESTRKPSSASQPQLSPGERTSSPRQKPSKSATNGDGACAPFYICFAAPPTSGMNGGPATGAAPAAYPGSYDNPGCSQITEAQALQMLQNSCSPGRSRRSQFGQGMTSGGPRYGYNAAGGRTRPSRSEYRQGMQPPLCCCCPQQGYQQQMQRTGYSPGPMDPRIPTDAMGQLISPAQGGSPYRSRSRKSVPLLTSYKGTSEKGVIATGTNDTGIMTTEGGQPQLPYLNAADCLPKPDLYRSQYPDMMGGLQTCVPQMCMPNVPGGQDLQQFIQYARMKSEMESNPCYPQIMKALKCMGLVTGADGDEDGEEKKKKKKSKKKKSKSKDKKKKKKGSKDKKKKKKGSKDKKKKKKK